MMLIPAPDLVPRLQREADDIELIAAYGIRPLRS